MARRPRRRHRHPHRGTVAVEPRRGRRPVDSPQRGRGMATRRPARPRSPVRPGGRRGCPCRDSCAPDAGASRTRRPAGRASPISPGYWRPVACRWESSARRRRHRAPSMRSPTCWRWRAAVSGGRPLRTACRSRWRRGWPCGSGSWWTGRSGRPVHGSGYRTSRQAVTQWPAPSPSSARRRSRSAGRHTPQSGIGCSRTSRLSRHWSPTGRRSLRH